MIARALSVFLLATTAIACTAAEDTSNIIESIPIPTEVVVYPEAFLGDVPCDAREGAMQSYVATLTDHGRVCASVTDVCATSDDCCSLSCNEGVCTGTDPEPTVFALPSSLPASCSQQIFFRYVVTGHQYTADIDGYTEPSEALTPRDGPSSGSRPMVRRDDPSVTVTPAWTTSCHYLAVAELDNVVAIGECDPLLPSGSPAETAIVVDPTAALESPTCTASGHAISRFDVIPLDLELELRKDIACSDDVAARKGLQQRFAVGLFPGVEYAFLVDAYEEGSAVATWRASCYAVAESGLTSFAACDHLAPL